MQGSVRPRRRQATVALVVLVVCSVVALGWPYWQTLPTVIFLVVFGSVTIGLVVGGYRLAARPGQRGNGVLLATAGLLQMLTSWIWDAGPSAVVGWFASPLVAMLLAWVLLRYPAARLSDPGARTFVVIGLPIIAGLRLLEIVTWNPAWIGYHGAAWWPTLWQSLTVHTVVAAVMASVDIILAVIFMVLLRRHHRTMVGLSRRQQVPLLISGYAGAVVFGIIDPVSFMTGLPARDYPVPLVDIGVPILKAAALVTILGAFLIGALLSALDRSRVAQFLVALDSSRDPVAIEDSLRVALADPDLKVLFREGHWQPWVDARGQILDVTADSSRVLEPLPDDGGGALKAVYIDVGMTRERGLLDAALSASRMALDNARLQVLAQTRLDEVRRSRQRLAEVGTEERRRLERDLHDGAQQRLLAVAAGLASARASTDDPELVVRLDDIRDGLRAALQELRDLANGIHPAVLTQSGLGPAIESAAERLAIPARVVVDERRWAPEVESAAYFVTSEAFANAVKHSGATHITVSASSVGPNLGLTIVDDGVGGAMPAVGGRGGMTGMRDRVAALGGDLWIDSPAHGGTTITALIPCG